MAFVKLKRNVPGHDACTVPTAETAQGMPVGEDGVLCCLHKLSEGPSVIFVGGERTFEVLPFFLWINECLSFRYRLKCQLTHSLISDYTSHDRDMYGCVSSVFMIYIHMSQHYMLHTYNSIIYYIHITARINI